MKNVNLIVDALNNYYAAKYNGLQVESLKTLLAPFGVDYVGKDSAGNIIQTNKRYLLFEDGEIIRLDKFCKQNGVTSNYSAKKEHTNNNGVHVVTANLNKGGKKAAEAEAKAKAEAKKVLADEIKAKDEEIKALKKMLSAKKSAAKATAKKKAAK